MSILRVVNSSDSDFEAVWGQLRGKLSLAGELLDNRVRLEAVHDIVSSVRQGGDAAVAELTAKFDGVTLGPAEFRVAESELKKAHAGMNAKLLAAVQESVANVRAYQEAIKISGPADWVADGKRLGVRYLPLKRVGACVPGASAPLVSTVIMTVVPAQVAGVEEVAVISSPSFEGSIHPAILGVCYELGVKEVYRVSGAQGVAALAFGTDTIGKVDKIVGPSSWWGQLAKKEVYGLVDIDSFAGPSEVLILADGSAKAAWVAADMLSQAEHAPGSAILVTDSAELASEVEKQLEEQLARLGRAVETRQYVEDFSLAIVTRDMDEAIGIANDFAAEHLQIQCRDSDTVAKRIVNAGAIFIGHYTPVAVGDYYAGPSHTLPTGGSARFFGALNVNDFLKQTSIISYDKNALNAAADAIKTIADAEGLGAHGNSVTIRQEAAGKRQK